MKKLIITAFAACSLMSGFGAVFTSTTAFAQTPCGPGAPEAWTRPGGFCDGSNGTKSLSSPVEGGSGAPCAPTPVSFIVGPAGARLHVAQSDPCSAPEGECSQCSRNVGSLAIGDRLHVAGSCCID